MKFESPKLNIESKEEDLESKEKKPESKEEENEFAEYEDLIKYNEDLIAQEALKPNVEYAPIVEELEELFAIYTRDEYLETLNAINKEEEAYDNEERKAANKALVPIIKNLKRLKDKTNIPEEKYIELFKRYMLLVRATGFINRGVVDHDGIVHPIKTWD
jgi:hypothetical protein